MIKLHLIQQEFYVGDMRLKNTKCYSFFGYHISLAPTLLLQKYGHACWLGTSLTFSYNCLGGG